MKRLTKAAHAKEEALRRRAEAAIKKAKAISKRKAKKIMKKSKVAAARIVRKHRKAIVTTRAKKLAKSKHISKKVKKALRSAKKSIHKLNSKARSIARRATKKALRAKRRAIRDARRVKTEKHRKSVHELGFIGSLVDEDTHAEWLRGESKHISVNARIRARRAAAVWRMFRMRQNAARLTRLVKTVHQARLNRAIKSHKAAIKMVHLRVKQLKAAKGRHLAARRAVYKARINLSRGYRMKRNIIKTWNNRIQARQNHRSWATKELMKAKARRTKAKMYVIAARASLTMSYKIRAKALSREKRERVILAGLKRRMLAQRAHAYKWNIILKKMSKHYADKQLLEIATGNCAKGNCKPYNPRAPITQF